MRPATRRLPNVGRRVGPEAGTTLVELMMVMILLSLVLPMVYGTMTFVQHQAKVTVDRFAATGNAQIAMDRVTKELRAATGATVAPSTKAAVFVSASAVDVTFYASLETAIPALVEICLAGPGTTSCPPSTACAGPAWPGCSLVEVITQGTGTVLAPVYNPTSHGSVDATNITSAPTVFTYDDVNGAAIPAATLATAAGRASIETVVVTLRAQAGAGSPSVPLSMQVPLPNVDYSLAS